MDTDFLVDEIFGERLLISKSADRNELPSNVRAAHAILRSFPEVSMQINAHTISFGHKNPEYTIKVGSINSFLAILRFVSSRLLRGGREQCGHCDRLTNSKMPKQSQKC